MQMQITDRQKQILFAIIEEYAEIATPVGSITLAKLFNVSSATIRSEMERLEDVGLLTKTHISSGRVPTDAGYRFYVNTLTLEDHDQLKRPTRALEIRIAPHIHQMDFAIRSAVDTLADLTGNLGLATIGDQLYIAGYRNLFSQPEFSESSAVQSVARLLDNLAPWLREAAPADPLNIYIGAENPIGKTSGVSLIISRFRSPYSDASYIGVLGPTRQSYGKVMSLVRNTGLILENSL